MHSKNSRMFTELLSTPGRIVERCMPCSSSAITHRLMLALICSLATGAAAHACEFEIRSAGPIRLDGSRQYDVFESGSVSERAHLEVRRIDSGTPGPSVMTSADTEDAEPSVGDPGFGTLGEVGMSTERPSFGAEGTNEAGRCRALVRVSPQVMPTLSRGSQRLTYQLLPESDRAVRDRESVVVRSGDMAPGDSYRLEYVLRIPAEQFVPHGTYIGELLGAVYPDSGSTSDNVTASAFGEPDERQRVPVSVEVGTAARLSLAGTQGRRQRVDFGQLRLDGKPTFPVELIVQASSGYALRIASENNGRLHQGTSGRDWFVPYELRVGQERVLLEQGSSQVVRNSGTAANGQRIPLNFRITDVTDKRAGVYTDRLTVEITPAADGF